VRRILRSYDLAVVADVGDRAHLIGAIAARCRSGVIPDNNPSNWWKRLVAGPRPSSQREIAARSMWR